MQQSSQTEPVAADAGATIGSNQQLQLLATGLNAHAQLSKAHHGQDISTFTAITAPAEARTARLLYASWSSTVLQIGSQVVSLGSNERLSEQPSQVGDVELFDAFGDHNGMLGCLDSNGRLWMESHGQLQCQADPDGSPLIGHVALAGNGKVAITFKQAPNGRLCHILCFDNLEDLSAWYTDPANVSYDAEKQHFMMQGQPRQVLAGTGTFLLRMEDGEVYSWGDPRYSSLGRAIAEVPAERPAQVDALGGLKIRKVAGGGWLNAALSEDGACYLWGAGTPGTDNTIKCLREAGAGEVALVELPNEAGSEPLDILDVSVGDNHVVLLAEGHRCFVAGENKNGQLGLGHFEPLVEDWTPLTLENSTIESVICGPKSTYAFTSNIS